MVFLTSKRSGLTPRIPRTVYRYFLAYPFLLLVFLRPVFSFWFRAADYAELCRLLSSR